VPGDESDVDVSIITGLSLINNFELEGSKWKAVVDEPIHTLPEEYKVVFVPPISTLLLWIEEDPIVPLDAIDTLPSPTIDIDEEDPPITADPFPVIETEFETPPTTV